MGGNGVGGTILVGVAEDEDEYHLTVNELTPLSDPTFQGRF